MIRCFLVACLALLWCTDVRGAGNLASPLPGVAASVPDASANYDMTPNNPLRTPLPVVSGAMPGDGLTMAPGTRNAFSLIMGSAQKGANITTSQSIRDHFFLNYMEGDLNRTVGSPMDTGQANNTTFAAVARHYPVGAPNDCAMSCKRMECTSAPSAPRTTPTAVQVMSGAPWFDCHSNGDPA